MKKVNYWMPVDQYIGGIEHAILHLLYSIFKSDKNTNKKLYPNLLRIYSRKVWFVVSLIKMKKEIGFILLKLKKLVKINIKVRRQK